MSDLDTIFINLKACLISVKNGIPLNQLENDYFRLNGERIPFKNLGFSSFESLLNSSGKFIIRNVGGVSIVQAKTTDKTQHLTELIKKQKSKPPKKKPFLGNKIAPRRFNISNNFNKPNSYSRQNSSHLIPKNNSYQQRPAPNHINSYKKSTSYSKPNQYSNHQPKVNDQNDYNKQQLLTNNNTDNYNDNHQSQYIKHDTKAIQQSSLLNGDRNYVKSAPTINGSNTNGKSYNKVKQSLPHTSSSSSLESTYNSSSSNNSHQLLASKTPLDKFQVGNAVNNTTSQMVDRNDKTKISKSNFFTQEKNTEFKQLTHQHTSIAKVPLIQNMPIKSCAAQSRLNKYPKKCDESSNKVDDGSVKQFQTEELLSTQTADLKLVADDSYSEILDDEDYIDELETYLKNLNLSEPYYECMVKKEKLGKTLRLIHICTIKVNEKHVSSSFPVECSTVDYAKKVAAKHALTVLKKQYGENVIYPITPEIDTMAIRIKEFLKLGYEENGLMGEVLERMYREKFQENLPDNWVQLLEVYSFFTFDRITNKIIIYLNDIKNNHSNDHAVTNGDLEPSVEEQNIVPGTPLMLENYDEKSVLVSANYGSTSVWIRFVGQNADENFIDMQAKFNDTMNTTGCSIVEEVTEGEFYAVLYNKLWHRVQVCGPTEEDDGTVTCFMVDTGEQLNISKDQICTLDPVFMKTKTQAIGCILTKLDNFGAFDGLKELLDEMILNKTFFLVPDSLEDGYARVTLYEKSEGSDRINVNEIIIQRLLEKSVNRLPSFEENAVVDGNVSSIVESGHLFLQLKLDIVTSLEEILPNDECLLPEYFLKSQEDIQKDRVYLAKYNDNDEITWCRAKIVDFINDNEVKICFIDYGNHAKCNITEIVNLELFDPLMCKIPPQAIKVTMNLIPPSIMTTEKAEKIFSIIGDDKILVNLINAPTNDVPCIQLYKIQPDSPDIPLCINIQLAQSFKKQ